MANTIGKVAIGLGVSVGLYAICLGVLMTPPLQRLCVTGPIQWPRISRQHADVSLQCPLCP